MTVIVVALVGVALVVAVAVGVAWQERQRSSTDSIIYGVEDSIGYVEERLSEDAGRVLRSSDVRRILERSIRYLQDPDVRRALDAPPVAGGHAAARYVQDGSLALGFAYRADVIYEVLEIQNEYLAALGAVGVEVSDDEGP